MSTNLTPDESARRDDILEEIAQELREEFAALESLRVFAVHGDSSNFDRSDAKALHRLIGEMERRNAQEGRLRSAVEQAVADLMPHYAPAMLAKAADKVLGDLRRALER